MTQRYEVGCMKCGQILFRIHANKGSGVFLNLRMHCEGNGMHTMLPWLPAGETAYTIHGLGGGLGPDGDK